MQIIRKRAYARAGLIGNPSDGYHGKAIALSLYNFHAEIVLYEWPTLEILPQPSDTHVYTNLEHLHHRVTRHGYYGGVRLIEATIKSFYEYCLHRRITLHGRNFAVRYASTIPQQVGLAGSSAIIIATLRALMTFYQVDIQPRVQPSLVLSVERRELGIEGGLQDRVIQVMEGVVAMDFSQAVTVTIDGYECGQYEHLDYRALPSLYIAYRRNSSEPTEVFHNDLRSRFDRGDATVVNAMRQFATLTDKAHEAIKLGDSTQLNAVLDANFDLRDRVCQLNPQHVEMIEVARSVGVSAKYAGSGGAIIGICESDATYATLVKSLASIDCEVIRPLTQKSEPDCKT